jgi:2-oxoglutarate dehydrogenase E2 component (dihydrolipoamide succinyltransferase)
VVASAAAPPPPQIEAELQQTLEVGPRNDDETEVLERVQEQKRQETQPSPPTPPIPQRSVSPASLPTPGPDDELIPLSPMRRAIAEHMVRSKRTAPHVTTVMEADLSRITAHRNKHKSDFERQGVKLTFTPYFVQAVVVALREVPIVNASFSDDGIVMHQRINVGMAVAIPDGLIVPVIKDADDKSLLGLSRAVNDLAERARIRRLQPDDMQDGTFTITNHGVSGSLFAMPIINQPQSAILGVGAIQKRAVVITENGLDALAIRPMCYLSLTFDHRLIDGATADGFLGAVKRTLEQYSS